MQRKVPYTGSKLKIRLLETRIDKENKVMLSVRESIRLHYDELKIPISNYRFHCNSNDVVNSEPYKGERVDDKLIYRYAKDTGLIPKSMKYQDFVNTKQLHKLDEEVIVNNICKKLEWATPKGIFDHNAVIKTLEMVYSEETVERVRQEVIQELLSR